MVEQQAHANKIDDATIAEMRERVRAHPARVRERRHEGGAADLCAAFHRRRTARAGGILPHADRNQGAARDAAGHVRHDGPLFPACRICSAVPARRSTKSCTIARHTRQITRRGRSKAAEPVVALVLPIAAGVVVLHPHRGDVFRVLEAELGGDADLDREAVGARQGLVVEFQRQSASAGAAPSACRWCWNNPRRTGTRRIWRGCRRRSLSENPTAARPARSRWRSSPRRRRGG